MRDQEPHPAEQSVRHERSKAGLSRTVIAAGSLSLVACLSPDVTEPDNMQLAAQEAPTHIWKSTFNGSHLAESTWNIMERNTDPEAAALSQFSPINVRIVKRKDGRSVLELDSRRHCVASLDEPLTLDNDTTGVCPRGMLTTYSSGRVQTDPFIRGDSTLSFNVRLNKSAVGGYRQALWALNDPYCIAEPGSKTYLRELDGLEWYSAKPYRATSTTHVGCDEGEIDSSHHTKKLEPQELKGWHWVTIKVEDRQVSYFLDHEQVGSTDNKQSFRKTTPYEYNKAFSGALAIIMNTEVFSNLHAKDKAFRAPDPAKPFPVQRMQIDSVVLTS